MNSLLLTAGLVLQAGPAYDHRHPIVVPVCPPPVVLHAPPIHRPVAVSVEEFSRCFRPTAGKHSEWVIHPVTGRPVEVCFTLPYGSPRVEVSRHNLEFDFGRKEVDIRFLHNCTVDVKYRD